MKRIATEQIPPDSYEYIYLGLLDHQDYSYSFAKQNNRRLKSSSESALASSLH
jgi:hypothetical protein